MKTLLLTEKGELFLEDNFNGTQIKVDTIKHYLDCPFTVGEGVRFEHLFNHILSEIDIISVLFSETMGSNKLSSFVAEWNTPHNTTNMGLGIDFLRFRKTLEYIEVDKNKGFIDIRVDFDGVGKGGGVDYSLEFMSINEMKSYLLKIDNALHINETIQRKDGVESYIGGDCILTLFEIIGTLLYEITFYGAPTEREDSKQKLMDTIDNKDLIEVLEIQLGESVRDENYEEASNLRDLIRKYKKIDK